MKTVDTVEKGRDVTRSRPGHEQVPHVLIAEDDGDMRCLLASELRRQGCDVVVASDGLELVQQLELHLKGREPGSLDAVVSDVRMPGTDGLRVLEWLRLQKAAPPCILITGFGSQETHDHAERLGAVAVLDKPFDFEDFRVLLSRVLRARRCSGQSAR